MNLLKVDGKNSWIGTPEGKVLYTPNAETFVLPRHSSRTFSIPKLNENDRIDVVEVPIRTHFYGGRTIDVGFADGRWFVFDLDRL